MKSYEYKGYTLNYEWHEEDKAFIGDCKTGDTTAICEGKTEEAIQADFREVVDLYLDID